MKIRIEITLILLIIAVLLAACTGTGNPTPTVAPNPTAVPRQLAMAWEKDDDIPPGSSHYLAASSNGLRVPSIHKTNS